MTRSTSFSHASLGVATLLLHATAWVLRRVGALLRVVLHRRDVRLLLEMDERQLRDIGLLRNDVLGALAAPLTTDPSTILLVRSVERRAERRAIRRLAMLPRRVKAPTAA